VRKTADRIVGASAAMSNGKTMSSPAILHPHFSEG
jgi:hypothetical protein